MEFNPRGRMHNPMPQQPMMDEVPPRPAHHQPEPEMSNQMSPKRKHIDFSTRTVRIELFIILLGCALLLVAVSLFLGFSNGSNSSTEGDLIAPSKYQAVFINDNSTNNSGFSTYFGHLKVVNDKYLVLQDVYYLTPGKSQGSGTQLTKLGCTQLHSPYDQMVINRSQVAYWENIKDDGKVVTAINQYIKQNPNGPVCTTKTTTTPTTSTTPATTTTP